MPLKGLNGVAIDSSCNALEYYRRMSPAGHNCLRLVGVPLHIAIVVR